MYVLINNIIKLKSVQEKKISSQGGKIRQNPYCKNYHTLVEIGQKQILKEQRQKDF